MSRIVLVSYASNLFSGVGNRVYYLSRELARLGHEVTVLTKHGEYVSEQGNVHLKPASPRSYPLIPPVPLVNVAIFNFEAYGKLKSLIKDKEATVDIQHVHLSPIVHLIRRNIGLARVVLTCHGTEKGLASMPVQMFSLTPLSTITTILEKSTFRNSGNIVAITNFVKDEIINHYGIPRDRVSVVPNGVDLKEFTNVRSLGLKSRIDSNTLILHLGGLSLRKGVHFLLQALAKLRAYEWTLAIVGSGSIHEKAYVMGLIQKLRLKNRILHFPKLRREALKSLLGEADVYVHPAIYEPQGIAVLEAMAMGKPIVASNIGGISETLGNAGLLVNPHNIQALAESIRALFTSKDLAKKLSAKARKRVKRFDWRSIAKLYEKKVLLLDG